MLFWLHHPYLHFEDHQLEKDQYDCEHHSYVESLIFVTCAALKLLNDKPKPSIAVLAAVFSIKSLLFICCYLELFPAFRCNLFIFKEKIKRIFTSIGARAQLEL